MVAILPNLFKVKRKPIYQKQLLSLQSAFWTCFECFVLLIVSSCLFLQRKMAPRRSFTREFKLESVRWYYENGKNINKTSNHFTVDRKRIRDWIKSKDSIRQSKNGSRSNRIGRVKYLLLEKELYKQFIEMRDTGKRVKRWWFNSEAKTMISKFYPDGDGEFIMSNRWFWGIL